MRRFALLAVVLLAGCANNFAKFYSGERDARAIPGYLPSDEPLHVFSSTDPQSDVDRLGKSGYVIFGESHFTAGTESVSKKDLESFAKKVGAQVVLISEQYSSTSTGVMPLVLPNTTTSYSTGSATAYGPGGPVTAYGSGTTTTYGNTTTYIPYSVTRNAYDAYFLVRRQPRLGISVKPMSDAEWLSSKESAGVFVAGVMRGSAADSAGILERDVLVTINGARMSSKDAFFRALDNAIDKKVHIVIYRDGQTITKDVTLSR